MLLCCTSEGECFTATVAGISDADPQSSDAVPSSLALRQVNPVTLLVSDYLSVVRRHTRRKLFEILTGPVWIRWKSEM